MLAEHVATFTNLDEFGDVHDIKYDGELYEDVPCTITRPKETDRDQTMLATPPLPPFISLVIRQALINLPLEML